MPITAIRHVRKMRGGAQAHLLQADDGHWYVVKFLNNPQHRRILINEILAAAFLEYLHVSVPQTSFVDIRPEFLAGNPELCLQLGSHTVPIPPGWHFGSRYPGDPARTAVYDILPAELLPQVHNLADFRGMLVFDQWVNNADGRQSVFFRAMVNSPGSAARAGFVTWMIDHGYAFEGPGWTFSESPLHGLYRRTLVYDSVRSLDDFQPWLDMVLNFPSEVIDAAMKRIPPAWLDDADADELERMLERLYARRVRLPELLIACRRATPHAFRNWTDVEG